MTSHLRIFHVITRLLLGVGVLLCVLGLAQSGASGTDAGSAAPVPALKAAHQDAEVHSHARGPALSTTSAHPPSAPVPGHPGHEDAHETHVTGCMVSTGAPALSVLAVPAVAGPAVVQAAPESRLHSAVMTVRYPRPPDRSALCVQRV